LADLYLEKAKSESEARFKALHSRLGPAETLIAGRACVYATGSFGRLEAGPLSDLDLFIVVETKEGDNGPVRTLDGIDETKLKCHLITAAEQSDMPSSMPAVGTFRVTGSETSFPRLDHGKTISRTRSPDVSCFCSRAGRFLVPISTLGCSTT